MKNWLEFSPTEFAGLAAVIGFLLMDHLSANAQNTVGNFFMLIAQVLETSANQKIYLAAPGPLQPQNTAPQPDGSTAQLEAQVALLGRQLTALKNQLGIKD